MSCRLEALCSVSGAGGDWVLGLSRAVGDGVGEGSTGSVEDVPEVAEVDVVVEVGDGLGAGLGDDVAASGGGLELKELVISVLLVQSKTSGPDVVILSLFLELIVSTSGREVSIPGADLIVDKGVERIAGSALESGSDVAASVEARVLGEVVLSTDSEGLDWANDEGEEIGKVGTGLEVASVGPVGLKSSDVSLDLSLVESVVLGGLLGESGWVLENGSPFLDGGDVVTHGLAGGERLRDLEGNKSEVKSSLDIVVPATGLDVLNTSLDLTSHELTTLEASLNLSEVVVTGHTVNESSNEVWDGHKRHVELRSEHL